MMLSNPDLIDALAAEYVLGTMSGKTRARFAKRLSEDLRLRQAVYAWEQRLGAMAMDVTPEAPPAHVWAAITEYLDLQIEPPAARRAAPWTSWLAAALAVFAVALSVMFFSVPSQDSTPAFVTVLQDADKQPSWIVETYAETRQVQLRGIAERTLPDGRVYELWVVPADGAAPVSLGTLDASPTSTLSIDAAQFNVLSAGGLLAISIEPAGGSPTGAPTGDIPFTGAINQG